jgi:hypothetical protein
MESLVPRPHKVGERWLGEAETERGSAICDCPALVGEMPGRAEGGAKDRYGAFYAAPLPPLKSFANK